LWQVLQLITPLNDILGSKNSFFPSKIFCGVVGLEDGAGIS